MKKLLATIAMIASAAPVAVVACDVTYADIVMGYGAIRVGEVGSYQSVGAAPDDPKRQALNREGMYVADYDTVHVFGTREFVSYVFTLNGCVVAEVRWTKDGGGLRGTPS